VCECDVDTTSTYYSCYLFKCHSWVMGFVSLCRFRRGLKHWRVSPSSPLQPEDPIQPLSRTKGFVGPGI